MSDMGRKDMGDKVQEKMTPQSDKSMMQSAKESVTGAADKTARDMKPDEHKSTTQSMSDKMSREKDSHSSGSGMMSSNDDKSMLDKAKDAMGMGDKKH